MAPIRTTVFASLAILASSLLAQQQAEAPVVLKATTRLVLVSVVAQNHRGLPVADLTKDDFRIRVNGKLQPASVFSVESTGSLPAAAPSTLTPSRQNTVAANVFTNRLDARTDSASGVNIILLDTRNTKFADQVYAKAQVIRYLRTLPPTDHIGVYTFGASLRVLHDYTSDSSEILNKLAASKKSLPDTSEMDAAGALQNDGLLLDNFIRGAGGTGAAERDFYTTDRVLATLRAFEFIANHLAQVPGRKNLIWVSGGFPLDIGFDSLADWHDPAVDQRSFTEEVDRTLRAMNDANIAVYPVDARGLMVDSRFSAENRRIVNRPPLAPPIGVKEQQTMQEIAGRTGGEAFYNTNDLAKAIHAAVDDSRVTYTLGFYPADSGFDGKFHKIDVETPGRSGVKLRYRKGYFDIPEKPQDDKSRRAELRDAVWSPIDASAMGISAKVQKSATDPASMDITLKIDHAAISLQPEQARWLGRLDILLVQRDDQGKEFGGVDDTVSLNLTQDNYKKLVSDDLTYHRVVVRAGSAKLLRIVVRDAASGAMGSVTVPLAKVI